MSGSAQLHLSGLGDRQSAVYRAIVVAKSGTVVNAMRLAADNEERAVQQAKAMVGDDTVELWDGLRFIERFSPVD